MYLFIYLVYHSHINSYCKVSLILYNWRIVNPSATVPPETIRVWTSSLNICVVGCWSTVKPVRVHPLSPQQNHEIWKRIFEASHLHSHWNNVAKRNSDRQNRHLFHVLVRAFCDRQICSAYSQLYNVLKATGLKFEGIRNLEASFPNIEVVRVEVIPK